MDTTQPTHFPEIWGGIECSINRVNNTFYDQLHFSDHYNRGRKDIESLASTGIRMIRYPVLWERHQPEKNMQPDWSWVQGQFSALLHHDIIPVATLLHHGSGPSFTNLLDENFVDHFVEYAIMVARQFPWLEYYTPINEPLTTARFSGLYGLWYPHCKSECSFYLMLLNEMKAIILAMKAIRQINPTAKLVQTEDLGKTFSSSYMQYQADYENQRRWLSYDMLCGKFNHTHPLWDRFLMVGVPEEKMVFFEENSSAPDIMGYNYYITSERYLHEDYLQYPAHTHGTNGKDMYADIEAVRVEITEPQGFTTLIKEAWSRYHLPIAITEVHMHCWREEQLRWFAHIYHSCLQLRQEGVNIRAITAWSMLGAYGWSKLLTQCPGDYEPGVFDIRSGKARPTALAKYIANIPDNMPHTNLIHQRHGWWQRPDRFEYKKNRFKVSYRSLTEDGPAPVIILGKTGTLGNSFYRVCAERLIECRLLSRQECDITDRLSIEQMVEKYQPWAIINATGYVRVDDAETDCATCFSVNTNGPLQLAQICKASGTRLVNFSTDLVFDGKKQQPYMESDRVNPLNVYGKSKAQAEELVMETDPSALIIRTAAFFSEWDEYNFVHHVLHALAKGQTVSMAEDIYISPTYVTDLVHATLDLLIDHEEGIWHLANAGETTWAAFGHLIARKSGMDSTLINPCKNSALTLAAPRPLYAVLRTEKGYLLPTLENALDRYLAKRLLSTIQSPQSIPAGGELLDSSLSH